MKTKDFDSKFDDGREDVVDDLDLATARRVGQEQKRINVDFPAIDHQSVAGGAAAGGGRTG